MAGSADLVIKILADVSQAEAAFSRLPGTIGKALGIGTAAVGGAEILKAAENYQSAMAKIAQADQSFTPGTAKYEQAQTTIQKFTTTLASSFEDVASVMAQAAKVTDAAGNKLPIDKINELTDASIRLQKSSQGSLDAVTALQDQAVLSKLFSSQDFAGMGNTFAALSQQHPQDENTLLDTTIALGQYGSPIGVTFAQSAAIANYLTDTGIGGAVGGSSVGRTLQRMNTAADQVLDPEPKYSDVTRHRNAEERLDDLQTQLKEAEARRSEMFGQNGLKRQFRRHPSEVMAADDHIARLQREIADQQADMGHLDDAKNKSSRGAVDILAMANTAGMDATAFAQESKDSPIQALLDFTRGVHNLPEKEREAAVTRAGITNVRDLKTIMGLTDQPDAITRMLGIADHPGNALQDISQIALDTTVAKQTDVTNLGRNAAVDNIGERMRQGLDVVLDQALKFGKALEDDTGGLQQFGVTMGGVMGTLGPFLGAAAPGTISKILSRRGSAVEKVEADAAKVTPGAAEVVTDAVAGGGMLGPLALLAAAAAFPIAAIKIGMDHPDIVDKVALNDGTYANSGGQPPQVQVNIGSVQHSSGEDAWQSIKDQFVGAWNAAFGSHPVTGQQGGSYTTGQGPN